MAFLLVLAINKIHNKLAVSLVGKSLTFHFIQRHALLVNTAACLHVANLRHWPFHQQKTENAFLDCFVVFPELSANMNES